MIALRLLSVSLMLTAAVFLSQPAFTQKSAKTWSLAIMADGETGKDGKRLELTRVAQDEIHLTGIIVLFQVVSSGQSATPLIIHGHAGPDGMFSPNVSLQVSNGKKAWQTIGSSFSESPSATLTIAAGAEPVYLRVLLDVFQPFIGKSEFGRITLQTGESVEFQLSLLSGQGFAAEHLRGEESKNNK